MGQWTSAVDTLRAMLSDGPEDKYRFRLEAYGQKDGSNTKFKTFDFRRITDLTSADTPLGVYVNGELVSASDDSKNTGDFILGSAPDNTDTVETSYYAQWFLDSEIVFFLQQASNWLGLGPDYTNCPSGLQPSLLQQAMGDAYGKLALKFAEHFSRMYRKEDSPQNELFKVVDSYKSASNASYKMGQQFRNDFYTRQGQDLAPNFGVASGAVRDPQPRR